MQRTASLKRYTRSSAWLMIVALGACGGQEGTEAADAAVMDDPDVAPAVEPSAIPAGYALRLDREGAEASEFHIETDESGYHVQTGPAGVFYDESGAVSGNYAISATFTEIEAPADHREGMGLIFGGSALQDEDQTYSYFLVRADGNFLIKRRDGSNTSNVSDGWVQSDAVAASTGTGDVTNTLSVRVEGDQVHFTINGQEVAVMPSSGLATDGLWGYRINHNLNVRVSDSMMESM